MKKKILLYLSIFFIVCWCIIFAYEWLRSLNIFEEKTEYPSVDLVAWWDIMLSRWIGWRARKEGYWRVFTWDNYNPLTQYDCYQSWDCILFFNLESMFSNNDNDQPKWWFSFRSNIANLKYLQDLKRDNDLMLSLANNHTNNAWWEGVKLTREVLDWENIGHIWAWNNESQAQEIKKIEKNWISLCFQAFSYDWNSARYWSEFLARNPLKMDLILQTLTGMTNLWCDVKILSLHWGNEYRLRPMQWQRDMAYELIDAWADIILWWHSHVPGSYEEYKWKPIFYSFWNFIFDQDRGKTSAEFDYIYDFELKRRTVPTYIPLLAWFTITKYGTGIEITKPEFKMARVSKGIYSPIDDDTFTSVMSEIAF
jgi:hypothetical protein